jgi:hypothetical protein
LRYAKAGLAAGLEGGNVGARKRVESGKWKVERGEGREGEERKA